MRHLWRQFLAVVRDVPNYINAAVLMFEERLDRPRVEARLELERTVLYGQALGMTEAGVRAFIAETMDSQLLQCPDHGLWDIVREHVTKRALGPNYTGWLS